MVTWHVFESKSLGKSTPSCDQSLYLATLTGRRETADVNKPCRSEFAHQVVQAEGFGVHHVLKCPKNSHVHTRQKLAARDRHPGDHVRHDSLIIMRAKQLCSSCFSTSMGDMVVELYWKHAPNTCRNFAELSRRGYYNGTKFHRIIKDFMIQGAVVVITPIWTTRTTPR